MIRKLLIATILLITTGSLWAQPVSDQQLAAQYFQKGAYDKAAMYYERLYDRNPSDFYYNYLFKCFIQLEDYDAAEKLVHKQLRRYPGDPLYQVNLGAVYALQGDEEKADKQYNKAIRYLDVGKKQLFVSGAKIRRLADAFLQIGNPEMALKAYQIGRKNAPANGYRYNIEMARIYGSMGNTDMMIREYLDMLDINPAYIQQVQNGLNSGLELDKDKERTTLLKQQLIKRVQHNPNKEIFTELLIWVFLREENYDQAFIYSRALDKRMRTDGERLMALGKLCTESRVYGTAKKCYQYVIDLGPDGYNYVEARIAWLHVSKEEVVRTHADSLKLSSVQNAYEKALDELGLVLGTVPLIQELALFEAHYLHDYDHAEELLSKAVEKSAARPELQGQVKLDLGDIKLIKGDIWDAELLYAQVDKSFKYDVLGEQAKFRAARIWYYTGNFKLARGQLDILKGATSKLIANDAMELSLRITDNTGVDTTVKPMQMYARADLLCAQYQFKQALIILDSIEDEYPGHALSDDILYMRYRIASERYQWQEALSYLDRIITDYGDDILADNALYYAGKLCEGELADKDRAKKYYEALITGFPGSLFVVDARERFRKLRGDVLPGAEEEPLQNQ